MPPPDTAWYEDTIRRVSPASSCRGLKTGMATMVVQFGLATMPLGIERQRFGVGLGHDEGHVGVEAPGRRVVDDDGAGRGQARGELARHRGGSAAQGEVDAREVGRLGVLDHDVLVAPGQRRAGGAGRGQVPHGRDGEVALEEDRAQDHADLAGRSHDGDAHRRILRDGGRARFRGIVEAVVVEAVEFVESSMSSSSGRTTMVPAPPDSPCQTPASVLSTWSAAANSPRWLSPGRTTNSTSGSSEAAR